MSQHEEIVRLITDIRPFREGLIQAAHDMADFKKTIKDFNLTLGIDGITDTDLASITKKAYSEIQRQEKARFEDHKQHMADEAAREDAHIKSTLQQLQNVEDHKKAWSDLRYREDAEHDRELFRARREGALATATRERQEAVALFNYRKEEESRIQAMRSGFNVSAPQAARVGAGAAVAMGQYQVGGGLYALANMMNSGGLSASTINVSAAAMTGLGVAVGGVAIAAGLLFQGKAFNEELAKMSTLLADANMPATEFRKVLDDTADAAVRVSNKFNMDLVDVVKGFKDALSAGIDARDLERFANTAGTLSTALSIGLGESTNILTTFKDTYELSIGQLASINDQLFNSVDAGKVTIKDMTANLSRLVPIAHAAGVSIKDIFVGVDIGTRSGLSTANTITGMAQFINGLVSPSEKAAKALHAVGIETGDAAFATKSLVEVAQQLRDVTKGSGAAIGALFPEERAHKYAAALQQNLSLNKEIEEQQAKIGTASIAAGRAMDTMWTDASKGAREFSNILSSVGSALANLWHHSETDSERKATLDFLSAVKEKTEALLKSGITDTNIIKKKVFSQFDLGGDEGDYQLSAAIDDVIKNFASAGIDAGKEFSVGVSKGLEEADKKLSKAAKDITTSPDDPTYTKKETKQLNSRLSGMQKGIIEDIKVENEEYRTTLDLKRKTYEVELASMTLKSKDYLVGQQSNLSNVINDPKSTTAQINDAMGALKQAQKWYDDAVQLASEELLKTNDSSTLIAKIQANIDKIKRIDQEALKEELITEDTIMAEANAEGAKKYAEWKKKQSEDYVKEFTKASKQIAEEEVKEYNKSIEIKKSLNRGFIQELKRSRESNEKLNESIWEKRLGSRLDSTDDPDRKRRIAMSMRDDVKARMDEAAANGTISSKDWDRLVEEFKAASEAIKSAMGGAGQKERGERNYQEDLSVLEVLGNTYYKKHSQYENNNIDSTNQRYDKKFKSAEEIASEAKKRADTAGELKKVSLEAVVKLQVDGTVSKETMTKIAREATTYIQAALRGDRRNDSRYDAPTRQSDDFVSSSAQGFSGAGDDGETE